MTGLCSILDEHLAVDFDHGAAFTAFDRNFC
jgi:hypothetical protein